MQWRTSTLVFCATLSIGASAALWPATGVGADLNDYKANLLLALPAPANDGKLRVTFLGVTTLLFDDGETAIMTDGYFTRVDLRSMRASKIRPDRERIGKSLKRAGVKSLAAVIVLHSHFDHALDSPVVAMETGALLVGSASTANIGRGYGMPEARIRSVAGNGDTLTFGRFKVTFVKSEHLPNGFAAGEISAPLTPPAAASDFKVGDSDTLLIEHDGRTLLVQGSAGYLPGALKGRQADVVFLGIGGLDTRDASYQQAYWNELVLTVGARRVVPVHWDDFFKPLDEPMVPAAGFERTMGFVLERGKADGIDIRLPVVWVVSDPFSGM